MQHCCKVGRVTERYGLQHAAGGGDVDDYLLARWLGRGEYSATGLRPLKDWFNKQLLKTVYTDHDRSTLGNRVAADYEALSGEGTDFAVLSDLDADGIDGERLQSDFLSTSTLYRHLTDCLGESKADEGSGRDSDWEADKVDYARDVAARNVRESLRSLENKDLLPGASRAEVKTEIVLGCPECATQVSFQRAVERGYVCQEHMGAAADGSTAGERGGPRAREADSQ